MRDDAIFHPDGSRLAVDPHGTRSWVPRRKGEHRLPSGWRWARVDDHAVPEPVADERGRR